MALQSITKNNSKPTRQTFSIINYYALEILESGGNNNPTQEEIDQVENTLYLISRSKKLELSHENIPLKNKKGKILLFEKETFFAYVHSKLLSNLNFSVDHIRDHEAFTQKNFHSYDLLIFSEQLPSFIYQLRKNEKFPFIIALLDQVTYEKRSQYFKAGAQGILKKCFLCQEFLQILVENNFLEFTQNKTFDGNQLMSIKT